MENRRASLSILAWRNDLEPPELDRDSEVDANLANRPAEILERILLVLAGIADDDER